MRCRERGITVSGTSVDRKPTGLKTTISLGAKGFISRLERAHFCIAKPISLLLGNDFAADEEF
jgi:hypothetical protein